MNIKLIGFDLDDTIWHNGPILKRAEYELYRWIELNHPLIAEQCSPEGLTELRKASINPNMATSLQLTTSRTQALTTAAINCGYDATTAGQFAARAMSYFLFWRSETPIEDDVLNALKQLAKRFTLVAISNGNTDLSHTPLTGIFSQHLVAEKTGFAKPDPGMLKMAEKEYGLEANQCLYVGDSLKYDQGAAEAAQWDFCWVSQEINSDIKSVADLPNWLNRS